MSVGTFLQITGAAFELGGIGTVAWGIAETRARFTDRPSLARSAWSRISRAARRAFRRRRSTTLTIQDAVHLHTADNVRLRESVGFGPWDDEALGERIERLRRAFENHESQLTELGGRLDDEERARREADERQEQQANEVRRELTELIREAAAGGLRLETIGVSLFAFGVVLQAWGALAN